MELHHYGVERCQTTSIVCGLRSDLVLDRRAEDVPQKSGKMVLHSCSHALHKCTRPESAEWWNRRGYGTDHVADISSVAVFVFE